MTGIKSNGQFHFHAYVNRLGVYYVATATSSSASKSCSMQTRDIRGTKRPRNKIWAVDCIMSISNNGNALNANGYNFF